LHWEHSTGHKMDGRGNYEEPSCSKITLSSNCIAQGLTLWQIMVTLSGSSLLSCNTKVHRSVNKRMQLHAILKQLNPRHTFTLYLFVIHFDTVLPPTPLSPKFSSLGSFRPKFCTHFYLFHVCYMPRQSHPPWFDHLNNFWWSVLWRSPVCIFLHLLTTFCLFDWNILLSILFSSSTLNLCSFLKVRDQFPHPYKTKEHL
jgi:hypothetical protein